MAKARPHVEPIQNRFRQKSSLFIYYSPQWTYHLGMFWKVVIDEIMKNPLKFA